MAGIAVRELVTLWGFDIDQKPLDRLDNGIKNVKQSLATIGAITAAAAGTLFGLAKFTANAGDQAFKMSQKVGIGVEALQELQFAAELSDVSVEQFQMGLQILSRRVLDAQFGLMEAKRAFQALGLQTKDANGRLKSADTLLLEISERFRLMPDGVEKTVLAMELFGRSGAEMIPLLNQGSAAIGLLRQEARDLGIVLDEETARASEEFNDNITRLMASFKGLRNMVGVELIPVLNDLVLEVKDFIVANRALLKQGITDFAEVLGIVLEDMLDTLKVLVLTVTRLSKAFGGLGRVFKVLLMGFSTFQSLKLALGFGQMIQGLALLTKGWLATGAAAAFANTQMLLIPLAITAAVVAIGLIIEDIATFIQGGDSVTGRLIKWFAEEFPNAARFFIGAFELISATISIVKQRFEDFFNLIMQGGGILKEYLIDPLMRSIEGLKLVGGFLGKMIGPVLGSAGEFMGREAANMRSMSDMMSVPAAVGASSGASGPVNNSTNIKSKFDFDLNVTGMAPEAAERVAKESISETLGNHLREIGRDAAPAIER